MISEINIKSDKREGKFQLEVGNNIGSYVLEYIKARTKILNDEFWFLNEGEGNK